MTRRYEGEGRTISEVAVDQGMPEDACCLNCRLFREREYDDQDNVTDGVCNWLPPPLLLRLFAALNYERNLDVDFGHLALEAPDTLGDHLCSAWRRKPDA